MIKNICLLTLFSLFCIKAVAGQIYTDFPKKINPSEYYVIYTHGKILEGNIERPVNLNKPEWGIYDFPAVKTSLSDDSYNLIAYHREKNTNPSEFAIKLKNDVNKLISAGVPANHITLVGFSRGGEITVLASNELKNSKLNVAILAGCTHSLQDNMDVSLYGNILSIYEKSDEIGPCTKIIEHSPHVTQFNEVMISTGLKHGAFFRPDERWILPLKNWIKKTM